MFDSLLNKWRSRSDRLYRNTDARCPENWDESAYLALNPDVATAVDLMQFASGWQHYVMHGRAEGRNPAGRSAPKPGYTRNCLDPWNYLEITPTHGVKPCCKFPPIVTWEPSGPTLEYLRNAVEFQQLRKQLLSGCLSDICQNCHIRPFVPIEEFQTVLNREYGITFRDPGIMAHPLHTLRLEVTMKCNLRCVYCPVSQPGYSAPEMAVESFDAIISLVSKQPRNVSILVNGHGETTFHPDWLRLCGAIIDLGFRPSIISNLARPLKDEEAKCLAGFDVINVSLDTVDAVLLSKIRRRVKLSNVLDNIHKIRAAAMAGQAKKPPSFTLSCGIYDANYTHLEDLAAFCISHNIRHVTFWQLVKYGDVPDATNVYPISSLDKDRIADAIHILEHTIQLLRRNRITSEVAGGFLDEWRKQIA